MHTMIYSWHQFTNGTLSISINIIVSSLIKEDKNLVKSVLTYRDGLFRPAEKPFLNDLFCGYIHNISAQDCQSERFISSEICTEIYTLIKEYVCA